MCEKDEKNLEKDIPKKYVLEILILVPKVFN